MKWDTVHLISMKVRISTDSKTSVLNKAFYSTVQNHLGELILTISKASNDSVRKTYVVYRS